LLAVRLGIVRSITLELIWSATRMSRFPSDWRDLVHQRKQLRNVVAIGLRQDDRQGDALSIGQQVMFAPQFASICWIWACFCASARSPQRGTIHKGSNPVDLVMLLKFRKESFKQPLPNLGFVPSPEPTQAGVTRGKIGRGGQPTPRNSGPQDEENSIDDFPGFGAFAPSMLNMTILSSSGKQRFQTTPEIVG